MPSSGQLRPQFTQYCYRAGLAATATGQLVAGITQTVFTVLPSPAPAALQTLVQFTSVAAVSRIDGYIYNSFSPQCDLQWSGVRIGATVAERGLVP